MRKLYYTGLESYKACYTLQLTEWNRRVFDRRGPLRRMMSDINNLHRRIERLEDETCRRLGFGIIAESQNMATQIGTDYQQQLAKKINCGLVPSRGLYEK